MIIKDYIVREILRTFIAVFVVLFLILLSTQLLRALSAVVTGKYPLEVMFTLLGMKNLESLTLLLPLSLCLAILLALSRLYKDSEMVALYACGIGPMHLLRATLPVVISLVVVQACLALYIGPWAIKNSETVMSVITQSTDLKTLEPGRFNISGDEKRVLYTQKINDSGHLENVFLLIRDENGNNNVLSAKQAEMLETSVEQERYIVFSAGQRYDGVAGRADYQIVSFDNYGVLLKEIIIPKVKLGYDAYSPSELMKDDSQAASAELHRRMSLIFMALLLPLLAVPMSKTSPRKGRYSRIAWAVLFYIVYTNLIEVAVSWIKKDQAIAVLGTWWVHILMFALLVFWVHHQSGGWRGKWVHKTHLGKGDKEDDGDSSDKLVEQV